MDINISQPWLIWSFGLMILFPLLMLVLSENILRLQAQKPALADTLKIIRNLVLPIFSMFLALTQVLGFDRESDVSRFLQTLLLLATIHLSLALVNVVFFVDAGAGTWQSTVPKLLRDLVRFFLILFGTAVVLSIVWKLNLGSLITALGVSSIVIGLALQDTLGNLFSGITLLFGRPFSLGHWIKIGDTIGKVVEVNWRAVHLMTREQELLIVPNSVLAKESFRNFNLPTRQHVERIEVGFSYKDPPNQVKRVLTETAFATKGVLNKPSPQVQTICYNESSIDYCVRLYLADYSKVPQVRDEFMSRIWYAARRHHLEIPFPMRTVYHQQIVPVSEDVQSQILLTDLKSLPFFTQLAEEDLAELVQEAIRQFYGEGEPILQIDEEKIRLHLILEGEVELFCRESSGRDIKISILSRGEFFGTMALLNQEPSRLGARALMDTDVLVFNTEAVQVMLAKSSHLAQLLGEILEMRRQDLQRVLTEF